MEISTFILSAVEVLKKCFGGIEIEILDIEMIRRYPDNFTPLGYLGVYILIDYGVNKHKVFFKNQFAEDILYSGIGSLKMAESFMIDIIGDDLPLIIKNFETLKRKLKLKKINELDI